jgi:hypothetical protein
LEDPRLTDEKADCTWAPAWPVRCVLLSDEHTTNVCCKALQLSWMYASQKFVSCRPLFINNCATDSIAAMGAGEEKGGAGRVGTEKILGCSASQRTHVPPGAIEVAFILLKHWCRLHSWLLPSCVRFTLRLQAAAPQAAGRGRWRQRRPAALAAR